MSSSRMSVSLMRLLTGAIAAFCIALTSTLVAASPAQAASTCASGGTIAMGKYYVTNNLWGAGSGSGWQCSWDSWQSGDTIGWGTNWDWSGQSNSVKSYSSTVLGWHWGWQRPGTELPVRIWDNRSIPTTWDYTVTGSGTMNVAYDLWLHTQSNPDSSSTPTDEIMIWPYRSGGAGPAGTYQTTVNIGGANWDLYRGWIDAGSGNGWNVFSFVRTSNTTSVNLNLRDFVNDLVYNRQWLSNSKYLTSVQAGTEVFIGSGQLNTNSYWVDVQ
ncbi:GH12 family glycosyl hydrolase domain-containing protein [Glycomyces terrestris]|uniref:Endo-1,4-beta-glucanase n=1 Tax=Glycomyces terrestris TaxID=2493553 RepID=A0A426V3R9_9ACTN|nr:endo-1,4-beta-glucanase [Glycomyces terrestris]RRS01492.1 endo-1,4-beta-glucanase [Glycomyces terrestris]